MSSTFHVVAQNAEDIIRYTSTSGYSSARVAGMGGAYGAVGADPGGFVINPAGIGLMRKSDIRFSLGYINTVNNSNYIGENSDKGRFTLRIPSFSLAIVKDRRTKLNTDSDRRLNFLNWSLSYNQVQNWSSTTTFQGNNPTTSLIDSWVADANNNNIPFTNNASSLQTYLPFTAYLGYNTYLINPDSASRSYYNAIPLGTLRQSGSIRESGSKSEIAFTLGANIASKLYWGGSIVLNQLTYRSNIAFTESDPNKQINDFNTFTYTPVLVGTGTGISARIGAIYQPIKRMRIGASMVTPTGWLITENYNVKLSSGFDNGDQYEAQAAANVFRYRIAQPFSYTLSGAFFPTKNSIFSIDYQTVNLSRTSVDASSQSDWSAGVSESINNIYNKINTLRVGAELKLPKQFLRAGVNYQSSPFRAASTIKQNNQSNLGFSFGYGIKSDKSTVDFSVAANQANRIFTPYDAPFQGAPTYTANISKLVFSVISTFVFQF